MNVKDIYYHEISKFHIDTTAYDRAQGYINKYTNLVLNLDIELSTCENLISAAQNNCTTFHTQFTKNAGCATGDMETTFTSKVASWDGFCTTVLTKMQDAYDTATQRRSEAQGYIESWTKQRELQGELITQQIDEGWAEEARKGAEATS